MNLILIAPEEVGPKGEVTLGGRRAEHVRTILRAKAGQSLRVGQLNGPTGTAMIKSVDPDAIALRCVFGADQPAPPRIDLLLALPRPKTMKRLWAPLASLGVRHLILTNAEKVERFYFDSHVLDAAFYTDLLQEGLEQAMDTCMPTVHIHRQFKPLIEDHLQALCPASTRLVADPGANERIAEHLDGNTHERILLAVGPEGGWSAFERELLQTHGFNAVSMGPRTLRTDVACIALLALANQALA